MTGIIYICIATLLMALAPVLVKKGTKKSSPAIGAAFATTTLAIICTLIVKNQFKGFNIAMFEGRTWIYLLVSSVATALCILFLFMSAHNSEVMHFLPVVRCNTILVVIISYFIFKTAITTNDWIIIALTVVGTLLMIMGEGGKKGWKWFGYALVSALFYSAFIIIDREYLSGIDGSFLMAIRLIIAAVIIWCVAMTSGGRNHIRSMSFIDGLVLILAGAAFGFSLIFYTRASIALGSSPYMMIYNVNLFVSMILATLLVSERITPKKLIGAILFIAALFM